MVNIDGERIITLGDDKGHYIKVKVLHDETIGQDTFAIATVDIQFEQYNGKIIEISDNEWFDSLCENIFNHIINPSEYSAVILTDLENDMKVRVNTIEDIFGDNPIIDLHRIIESGYKMNEEKRKEIIDSLIKYLGEDGMRYFKHLKGLKGNVFPVLKLNEKRKGLPVYSTWLFDGMQIRNYLNATFPEMLAITKNDYAKFEDMVYELVNDIVDGKRE